MNDIHLNAAKTMLDKLLHSQPNLIKEVPASKENGEHLAAFCSAFIQKYSEQIAVMEKNQSPR